MSASRCPSSASNRVQSLAIVVQPLVRRATTETSRSLARQEQPPARAATGNGSGERGQVRPGRGATPPPRAPRGGAGRRARARTQGSLNAAARVQRPGPRVRTSGPPWPVLTWAARKRRLQYLSPSSGLPGVQQGFKCVSKQLAVCA